MTEEATSNVQRIRALAAARGDEIAYVHLAMDGIEASVTFGELDARSSQLAAALAARGVGIGDRGRVGHPELA